ncbi:Tubulin-tyrosine ligase family protein [Trichomonas vaginalis G3]|uniref:Tubulin-tyrosine ligase family protein n=1 Tax=Trichomonas vaginalis (strain ATCC PRA-98 / G3) TaxID=412133 RepID=A2G4Z6_TRIV3|nr:positive regulation of cilium movement [Trichomonas vaginalis G3]EAX87768.1 Tubulin-tyrosine ligase family protein [Trichomonas vaginalis G3]KAI5506127.1 positive regulation of cilium movement [Trichomonas vaginalis G3]|eukprot:XP_001300698.1 Tubulin-tyrosine ligase family protein [Trichomonas vaginalis G3]
MLSRGTKIEAGKVKYPIVKEAFAKFGIDITHGDPEAKIVWFDGTIPPEFFLTLLPYQRLNKIPGMDYICFKSNTFQALNACRYKYPKVYTFYPLTFLLPFQYSDFQHEHLRECSRTHQPVTWIVKPRAGCCGNGIKLIQNTFELAEKKDSCIVQSYISPFLVNGYKFDFRFYVCISTLNPYTVFIYNEGIARFCTKKYSPPTRQTLDDKYCHLTNTAVNVTNEDAPPDMDFTRRASEVLAEIVATDPRGAGLWDRIKTAAALTAVAIYSPIVAQVLKDSLERKTHMRTQVQPQDKLKHSEEYPNLAPLNKYFHIMGIDVLINDKCEPIILELNDRPSMHVTFDYEEQLKPKLIYDALSLITTDGTPPEAGKTSPNWEQILPVAPETALGQTVSEIMDSFRHELTPKLALMNSAKKPKFPFKTSTKTKLPPLRPACQ